MFETNLRLQARFCVLCSRVLKVRHHALLLPGLGALLNAIQGTARKS